MSIATLLQVIEGGRGYRQRVMSLAPIAYWPLNEASGTVAVNYGSLGAAANGTYDGCTLGAIASPGGGFAPFFDGTNDLVNIYSTALNGGWNGQLFTISIMWKVSAAAVWTDAAHRRKILLLADANNAVLLGKTNVNNQILSFFNGSTTQDTLNSVAFNNTGWNVSTLTVSKAADQYIWYQNGSQVGATQTGIGTWAGALSSTKCIIGSDTIATHQLPWKGYLAHAAIWNRVLSPTEVSNMCAWVGAFPFDIPLEGGNFTYSSTIGT